MADLTTFRQNIQTELGKDLGIQTIAWPLEGPLEDRDLICVWVAAMGEVSGEVDQQDVNVTVRVLKQWTPTPDLTVPPDVAPLEALAESVQTSLKDIQTTGAQSANFWMFRVVTVTPVYEQWAVEAEILAKRQNPFLR